MFCTLSLQLTLEISRREADIIKKEQEVLLSQAQREVELNEREGRVKDLEARMQVNSHHASMRCYWKLCWCSRCHDNNPWEWSHKVPYE